MAKKKKNESGMTSRDIEKVQILAITKDGQHLMAISEDRFLIDAIVSFCKFARLKDDLFAQCSLKELIDDGRVETSEAGQNQE